LPDVIGRESRSHIDFVRGSIELLFGFGRRDGADAFEQPAMVEPVDPFESGVIDGSKQRQWSPPVDLLGLVEAIDGSRPKRCLSWNDQTKEISFTRL
jgi:hypothetical protein